MSERRFEFGKNWKSFLAALGAEQIDAAEASLRELLDVPTLAGKRFIDLGCGSGLFSLAAHRLGAEVVSIDFDPKCVACTESLQYQYGTAEPAWLIRRGSVLDKSLMESLGKADVVYSWCVLHHTGDLWRAIDLAAQRTEPGGLFCIAVYNDQGAASQRWLAVKRAYHAMPSWLRPVWVAAIAGIYEFKFAMVRGLRLQNPLPLRDWRSKRDDRGMSVWYDWVDWVGGLPFQPATPVTIESRLGELGFTLVKSQLVGKGWGCNEFVFRQVTGQALSEKGAGPLGGMPDFNTF